MRFHRRNISINRCVVAIHAQYFFDGIALIQPNSSASVEYSKRMSGKINLFITASFCLSSKMSSNFV